MRLCDLQAVPLQIGNDRRFLRAEVLDRSQQPPAVCPCPSRNLNHRPDPGPHFLGPLGGQIVGSRLATPPGPHYDSEYMLKIHIASTTQRSRMKSCLPLHARIGSRAARMRPSSADRLATPPPTLGSPDGPAAIRRALHRQPGEDRHGRRGHRDPGRRRRLLHRTARDLLPLSPAPGVTVVHNSARRVGHSLRTTASIRDINSCTPCSHGRASGRGTCGGQVGDHFAAARMIAEPARKEDGGG